MLEPLKFENILISLKPFIVVYFFFLPWNGLGSQLDVSPLSTSGVGSVLGLYATFHLYGQ